MLNRYLLGILLLFTIFSRSWGIESYSYFFDEALHIPSAFNYVQNGQFSPDFWYHPPLKHIMLYGSMKIFGNNPYGWRMRNVIFGTLSVLLLFKLGEAIFADRKIAYMAALFMAVEPMHIFTSRIASEEIPGIFFCLAGVYAALLHMKGKRYWIVASGIFLGLALAAKWYFQITLIALLVLLLVLDIRKEGFRWSRLFYISSSMTLLPAGIYLLTFVPWFYRGYSLAEFVQMQFGAYKTLQSVTMTGFFAGSMFAAEWFIKPIVMMQPVAGVVDGYQVYMSNFPVWLLTIPSVAFVIYRLRIKFEGPLFLVLLAWLSMYLPIMLVKRPMLLYSALPLLPFVYLMVAYFIVSMFDRARMKNLYYNVFVTGVLLWGAYLWSLVVRLPVPGFFYEFLRVIVSSR